jgi:8-oxo-dGTP diphosphatase
MMFLIFLNVRWVLRHRGNYCGVVDAELPAVPASAGALIFDRAGRLLILKPTYKTGWTIPGGVMEADGETPWDAITVQPEEIAEYRLVPLPTALVLLRPPLRRRVRAGTRRRRCVYLENGRPVPGIA